MGASSSKKKKDKKGDLADAAEGATSSLTKAIEDTSASVTNKIDNTTKSVTQAIDSTAKNLTGQAQNAVTEANKSVANTTGGLSSAVSDFTQSVEKTTQDAVSGATKTVTGVTDSVKAQVDSAEGQVQQTTADITKGLKEKSEAVSKTAQETIDKAVADVNTKVQSATAAAQQTVEDTKKSVESKFGNFKTQAEASKTELKGHLDGASSKVSSTAATVQGNLNELNKQGADAVKQLENQANETKKAAENKASELRGAAEAKATEFKSAADAKAAELKSTADAKAAEFKSTADAKAAELRTTVDSKATALKNTANAKAADLKSSAESKASELQNTATGFKDSAESKAAELRGSVEKKTTEFKSSAEAKAAEIKGVSEAKVAELKSQAEELKGQADTKVQDLQNSVSQAQDKVEGAKSDLSSGADTLKGNVGNLAGGLKSAVSGAVEGAVHVATDTAHKTVEGVGQTLTKATKDVSNSLTGAVNQVSTSVTTAAGSAVTGLLGKAGAVGSTLAQGAANFNTMAGSALEGFLPTSSVVVCGVDDLKDGEMKVFKIGDDGSVLLVKENGSFSALGTKCSHYGAPLAKGVLYNGTVRCPWHGACFNAKTGDIEDSPGLDSLPCYQVTIDDGQVKVSAPSEVLKHNMRTKILTRRDSQDSRTFVIIGGGGAGESCAETLRQLGFAGRLVVLTKEDHLPYDRPKLSKALSSTGKEIALRNEDYFKNGDIEVLLNHEVSSLDLAKKVVTCSNDATFSFNKLLIATGGTPITLDVPGNDLENIFYLRTPSDANKIAEAVKDKNAVVVGTSFIGMEVASYMNGKAKSVNIIGRSKTPFEQVFGEQVGERLKTLCVEKGMVFHTETQVEEFVGSDGKLTAVKLKNGEEIAADICVIGIGVKPATDFLKESGIPLNERGFIPVDQTMKTSLEDVFGAGDIVEFSLPVFNVEKATIGHWQMAQTQGRHAAHGMLEDENNNQIVPFFWCAMFGKSLRFAGYATAVDDYIIDGDLQEMKFILYICSGDRVVAVATMGSDPVASNFASYVSSGKILSKSEIQNDPKAWISQSF